MSAVEWSEFRDWKAGSITAQEAIERSPYRDAFMVRLAEFAAKANRHEQVKVMWWHAPYVYVEVCDSRHDYPGSARALVSFDLTNGEFAHWDSAKRYVIARRGWVAFLTRLIHYEPPVCAENIATARGAGPA